MFSEDAAAGLMDHSLHRVDSQSKDSVYGQTTARLMRQRTPAPFCANITMPSRERDLGSLPVGIWGIQHSTVSPGRMDLPVAGLQGCAGGPSRTGCVRSPLRLCPLAQQHRQESQLPEQVSCSQLRAAQPRSLPPRPCPHGG